jgi:glutamate 5-kinase
LLQELIMKKVIKDVLVVKVGTSTLTQKHTDGSERLDVASFERIGKQLAELQSGGLGIVLVSSAAITAGMTETGLFVRPSRTTHMNELQRLASIGWRHVMNAWSDAMAEKTIGELLLTQRELNLASERDELLRVTHTLLSHGNIAVANENDAITHEEIAFGDNDSLAATFAAQIKRSALFSGRVRLVVLTDVDGVYTDKNDSSTIIRHIANLKEYLYLADGAGSRNGTGGMVTKFEAARIAMQYGVEMFIANGRQENVLHNALNGEAGTRFIP